MGKRSDFPRRPMDDYQTPFAAVPPLLPHLCGIRCFAEPCAGDGHLVRHLESLGLQCVYRADISEGIDALKTEWFGRADAIITNPPWSRWLLHPMIEHFAVHLPTWLLFDSDWVHTRQSARLMDQCSHIVSVGRLKCMPGTKYTGKDNAAWYRFDRHHRGGPRFIGRNGIEKMADDDPDIAVTRFVESQPDIGTVALDTLVERIEARFPDLATAVLYESLIRTRPQRWRQPIPTTPTP